MLAVAIIIQIVLISLNAIFASAEIAVISSSQPKLELMAKDGHKGAKRLLKLSNNPSKFLSTIQVAITLSSLLGSAFAAENLSEPLSIFIISSFNITDGAVKGAINTLSLILITLALAFFSIVFGELVPKRVAMKNPEKSALRVLGLLSFVSVCFKPFVWVLTKTTNIFLRLFKINPNETEAKASEEEIRLLINSSSESGEIDKSENEMIQNIFEFDDITVSEICTHRTDVSFLYLEDSFQDWKKLLTSTRHGFYPICKENTDNIVGILNAKRFFRSECTDMESTMKKAVDKPYFVSESIKADTLFEKMKETRNYFSVVVDEYGGTLGVVTMHDLLEVLVGELNDKDDEEIIEITKITDTQWEILGSASISDVEKELDIKLQAEDFDTFGGYIFGLLDSIPDDGTKLSLSTEDLIIQVLKIEDHRIEKTIVTKKEREIDDKE
ncbi:MAG: HlyC/CorC family transporter [Clostridia bacterium]|nr:HlyC/CorC family transporter [Clostridia bacterium]